MSKFICLIDGRSDFMHDFFIHKILKEKGFNSVLIGVDNLLQRDLERKHLILVLHLKYIWACLKAVCTSRRNDIIIVWLDIMGVYTYLASKILLKKRNILILNIMNPQKNNFYSRLRDRVYRIALQNENCHATVNTGLLVDYYRKSFNLPQKAFHILPDAIHDNRINEANTHKIKDYVFFGGSGGRDYELAIKIAEHLPQVAFVFVVRKKNYFFKRIPENVKIYYDISADSFNNLMMNSSLIILPVKVDTPAGIIVLITAGLMSKCVIASNTITIKDYIHHKYNGILVSQANHDKWVRYIKVVLNNITLRTKLGIQLKRDIVIKTSHKNYMINLVNILDSITNINEFMSKKSTLSETETFALR